MTKKKTGNKLEKAVDAIVNRLEKAENFVLDQSPQVCKEVIKEKFALTVYSIILCTLMSAGLTELTFFLARYNETVKDGWPAFLAVISGMAALISAIIALCEVSNLISLKTAPKLTILRELKRLLAPEPVVTAKKE